MNLHIITEKSDQVLDRIKTLQDELKTCTDELNPLVLKSKETVLVSELVVLKGTSAILEYLQSPDINPADPDTASNLTTYFQLLQDADQSLIEVKQHINKFNL
nr:hypothetical protein [Moritella viscosa]SHO01253.1 Serine/threonine kinase [Moritella viscosa]